MSIELLTIKNSFGLTSLAVKWRWNLLIIISLLFFSWGVFSVYMIFKNGLGVLPLSNSVLWGTLITNFVFWIGIAHAGTFISAILLLSRQKWRIEIHRLAEAITIISILIAAMMPIIHLGKPLFFYKILPIRDLSGYFLQNFSSPLNWDFYAIGTYFILSVLFFQLSLLPDLAAMRDISSKKWRKSVLNFFSNGWTGSFRQWQSHQTVLLILASLITPLVIAVHSIVSFDFAVTVKSGWNSTVFPLYFVIGALFSGFAMVSLFAVLVKKYLGYGKLITDLHFNNLGKMILFCCTILLFVFLNELIGQLYSGNRFEMLNLTNKAFGGGGMVYILSLLFTLALPQIFWLKKYRLNQQTIILVSVLSLIGMWLERFVIVIGSQERNYLPSSWVDYHTNFIALGLIFGFAGFFLLCMLMIGRWLPFIPFYEINSKKS